MKLYGEASYSISADLLDAAGMVSGMDAEVLCMPEDGGITVGVRVEAKSYAEGLTKIMLYAGKAAKFVQLDGIAVPEAYKVCLFDSRALEAHYHSKQWLAQMSGDDA